MLNDFIEDLTVIENAVARIRKDLENEIRKNMAICHDSPCKEHHIITGKVKGSPSGAFVLICKYCHRDEDSIKGEPKC